MVSEKVIQSYVLNRWFVSTIRRESSACVEPPASVYCETMVWEWNPTTRETGGLIGQTETCRSDMCGVVEHFSVCQHLVKYNGWNQRVMDGDEEEAV